MAYATMRTGAGELVRALRAIGLDAGATAWTLPLPYKSTVGMAVAGMLDGQVYVTGSAASPSPDRSRAG
ncbi:hypothetical protein [Streptomyces sp. AP-93]|uniref:hypothetical protein n=1 Tax=Streptomyces sp. AP-93 TaxID=2929048 RepID=UPI001FB02623|nr:hypothetical protein [Streptomyces sp. AP-93]MCJ0869687.1 hypothetical protein [Streptomyces sp. AP-93]